MQGSVPSELTLCVCPQNMSVLCSLCSPTEGKLSLAGFLHPVYGSSAHKSTFRWKARSSFSVGNKVEILIPLSPLYLFSKCFQSQRGRFNISFSKTTFPLKELTCPLFSNPRLTVGREVKNFGASNVRKVKFQDQSLLKSN